MRAVLVLAGFLCAARAFAGEGFIPGGKPGDSYSVENLAVTRGYLGVWPAARLRRDEDGSEMLAVALSSAGSWEQARSACRLMSPRGAWDLPSTPEAAGVAKSGVFGERLRLSSGDGYYPIWTFEGLDPAETAEWYDARTVVLVDDDGRVSGMYDLSALDMLAGDPRVEDQAKYVRALSELTKGPVVCVSRRFAR